MHFSTVCLVVATATLGLAQPPKFDVASLKPTQSPGPSSVVRPSPSGDRYVGTNASLRLMIQVAYRLKAEQVVGGPDWVATDTWDLNAKTDKPSTTEDLRLMLQDLLAERFHLKLRRDVKELPAYILSVDKAGAKLIPHQPAHGGDQWIDQPQQPFLHVKLSARYSTMDYFAFRLSQLMDRPVVNHTELKGGFDFELTYTRDLPPNMSPGAMLNGQPIDTSGPTIFGALRQQLGLKLEAQKAPVEIQVIEHVEKPTEN
jgi:uncharacterized protein (TIGR03435 family)